jgi:hypothetical protein
VVASTTGLDVAVRFFLHRLASGLNIPASLRTHHARMREARTRKC